MTEHGAATAHARRLDLVRRRMAQRHIDIEHVDSADRPLDEPVALHPAQRLLWLHQQRRPDSCAYNVTFVCTIDGAVDVERLRDAVRACCERQLLTATRYGAAEDGMPRQHVVPDAGAEITVIDGATAEAFTEQVDRHAAQLSARPFDLARESALRVHLIAAGQRCALVVSVHHIMWDGPSLPAFFEQISHEYRGVGVAIPVQLRDLVRPADERQQGHRERSLRYWMTMLRTPTALAAPQVSAVRAGERVEAAATFTVELGPRTGAHLNDLCALTGATEFAVFTAALEIALSAHADADSVGLATMMSWRTTPGSEGLWANLGHTVRLRRHLTGAETFAEVVGRVTTDLAATVGHLDVAFDDIDAAARDRPDVDTQVSGLVLYQRYAGALDLPGAESDWRIVPPADVAYPFTVQGVRHADALHVYCTYQRHVIDERDIRAVIDHLADLVSTAPPTATVEQLRRSTAPVETWVPDLEQTVLDLVEPVFTHASGPAIVDGEHSLDYAELDTRSAALAGTLRSNGVQAEDVVAVLLPRSAGIAVALLAILRAGGAYVFVPTDFPDQRVGEILRSTSPRAILLAPDAKRPEVSGAAIIAVDSDGAHQHSGVPMRSPRRYPRQRAAVYYTSGSTGQAKAVDMTDAALAARVRWGAAHWPVRTGEARLAKSKMSFIDGATEILEGLVCGATVAIADDRTGRDAQRLAQFATRHRARHMMAVPTLLRALLELEQRPLAFDSVVSTGEPLSTELVAALRHTAPNLLIENSYGCTETAGDVTVGVVDDATRPTVGRAPAGGSVVVLNHRLHPARPGALGEVYVRGPQVVRGYLADPGLTSTRFVADPDNPGGRMYRTGDIGRLRDDGNLDLVGRRDAQVKVRGQRVDTGEVAAALQGVVGADATVAVIARARQGSTELLGYLATRAEVDELSVRRALSAALPPYMVPARIVRVERIPLLPNGKVDRGALIEIAPQQGDGRDDGAENDAEKALLDLARQLAGRPDVGVTDNLFEYGIDSIRAVSLVRRARAEAALGFDIDDVFLEPTVRGLAALAKPQPGKPARQRESVALPWPAALLRRGGVGVDEAFTFAVVGLPDDLPVDDIGPRLSRALHAERFEHLRRCFTIRGRLWRTHRGEEPREVPVVATDDLAETSWMTANIDLTRGQTVAAALVTGHEPRLLLIAGSALVATGSDLTALAASVGGYPWKAPGPAEFPDEPAGRVLALPEDTTQRPDRVAVTLRLAERVDVATAVTALSDVLAARFGIDVLDLDRGTSSGTVPFPRGRTAEDLDELRDDRIAAEYRARWAAAPLGSSDGHASALFQESTAPPILSSRDAIPFPRRASGVERVYPLVAQHHPGDDHTVLGLAMDPLIAHSAAAVLTDWAERLRSRGDRPGKSTPETPSDTAIEGEQGA
ncbi:AMP-binding protein [Nocardia sp. NPDC058176]|uniref:AMP-binding protein n=1 Tax=Nocardia sp. NPDC058176 TaxID=3346368 RepID=UPI0036DEAF46